mmetsp:Transcript_42106/g.125958  ORF Transcript_42106/g.125958 Transcript_42106/m.125958 type:complete len:329 (-) Transcript_42106:8-994(-)
MVVDGLTDLVPAKRGLGDRGQEHLQLHDVVDRSKDQHGQRPLLIVLLRFARPGEEVAGGGLGAALLQQARADQEHLDEVPLHLLMKGLAGLPLLLVLAVAPAGPSPEVPVGTQSVGEALATVEVQAHQPEEGKHRSKGALVLVVAGAAARRHVNVAHVEKQLRKCRADIIMELFAGVAPVPDPRRRVPCARPVCPPAPHQPLQDGAPAGGEARRARGRAHTKGRGGRLRVRDRQAPLHRGDKRRGCFVQDHALGWQSALLPEALEGVPAPVLYDKLAFARSLWGVEATEGEVVAIGQPDDGQRGAVHVDDVGRDFIDEVDGLEPGEGP